MMYCLNICAYGIGYTYSCNNEISHNGYDYYHPLFIPGRICLSVKYPSGTDEVC